MNIETMIASGWTMDVIPRNGSYNFCFDLVYIFILFFCSQNEAFFSSLSFSYLWMFSRTVRMTWTNQNDWASAKVMICLIVQQNLPVSVSEKNQHHKQLLKWSFDQWKREKTHCFSLVLLLVFFSGYIAWPSIRPDWPISLNYFLFLLSKIFYFRFASSCIQIAYLSVATVVRRNHWQKKNCQLWSGLLQFLSSFPWMRRNESRSGGWLWLCRWRTDGLMHNKCNRWRCCCRTKKYN